MSIRFEPRCVTWWGTSTATTRAILGMDRFYAWIGSAFKNMVVVPTYTLQLSAISRMSSCGITDFRLCRIGGLLTSSWSILPISCFLRLTNLTFESFHQFPSTDCRCERTEVKPGRGSRAPTRLLAAACATSQKHTPQRPERSAQRAAGSESDCARSLRSADRIGSSG
jgi:hypothetical protein